jgi:heat shock protein HslJ
MIARRSRLPVLAAVALCAAACAPATPPAGPSTPPAAAAIGEPGATPEPAAAVPAPDPATTLAAHEWKLQSATDAAGQSIAALFPPQQMLGLLFGDGRINVTGGCNRMSAAYRLLDAASMEVSPGPSTMMACPPPLAAADTAIAGFLRGTLQVALAGEAGAPTLRLAAADGSALTFGGTPTPETRFGGPGTRAFLEVSTEPCAAPAAASCLRVRERTFDEKGLESTPPGEWRDLPEGIEGYTRVAGEQQVVRVKRFETTGAEPKVHHVFDMVVRSSTVP